MLVLLVLLILNESGPSCRRRVLNARIGMVRLIWLRTCAIDLVWRVAARDGYERDGYERDGYERGSERVVTRCTRTCPVQHIEARSARTSSWPAVRQPSNRQ
ncbi:MAG: hypothetical protein ACI8UD_003204 [Planctomycetota bacterium]|jgi:hypothetical protein